VISEEAGTVSTRVLQRGNVNEKRDSDEIRISREEHGKAGSSVARTIQSVRCNDKHDLRLPTDIAAGSRFRPHRDSFHRQW
jgi:hypothetical protein